MRPTTRRITKEKEYPSKNSLKLAGERKEEKGMRSKEYELKT
jgi:hypothetical protein